jgi:hypothetical protein
MYAVEFNANIMDGKIEIPARYRNQFSAPHDVKVILMKQIKPQSGKAKKSEEEDSGFGALSRYANPELWDREARAWERAAVKKHDAN